MKIAPREQNLLGITIAVILLAVTYLMLEPKFQEWREFRDQREDLQMRLDKAERLLASREQVESSLAEFRKGLPVFPEDKRVEAELLQSLEKMAGEKGLVLKRREADPEREAGDLYETSITCHWEGDLNALVEFLYAQQSQGAVSDVRQLSIQPSGGRGASPDRLKGTFTMDYAYRRETGAIESPAEPVSPELAEEVAQP
jgi:Tfp pilus assembly protein PilO